MMYYVSLILDSILLGFGLAMDAFSVSLANGFAEPRMSRGRKCFIAGIYAVFQFAMPVIGWFLVNFALNLFRGLQGFIPFIALILLVFIGGNMIREGIESRKCSNNGECDGCEKEECEIREVISKGTLTTKILLMQGIATSIDALSVGFTITGYSFPSVICSALIIGVITFFVCFAGLFIGTKFGTKLSGNARIIGGLILIGIGIEIFVKGMLG